MENPALVGAGAAPRQEPAPVSDAEIAKLRRALLGWYDANARDLPWRIGPAERRAGRITDPYHVYLSETMLQQTTVATVAPRFLQFIARWPTLRDLAQSPLEAVLDHWSGLGYYARARNLHACAQHVVRDFGGAFPADIEALKSLPGIGPYTAAAIAAIAFDLPIVPVDGNIERVTTRLFAIQTPLPAAKGQIAVQSARFAGKDRPGDVAQALMDLGAGVCIPRQPRCPLCPWAGTCRAASAGIAAQLPQKPAKIAKPQRFGAAFIALKDGEALTIRRPPRGLLGGMRVFPSADWIATETPLSLIEAPFPGNWRFEGVISHEFTHFALRLRVYSAAFSADLPTLPVGFSTPEWRPVGADLAKSLPTVMRKALHKLSANHPYLGKNE